MRIGKVYIFIAILGVALLLQLCSVLSPVRTETEKNLEDQALLETEHSEIGRQQRIDSILQSWKPSKVEHYKPDSVLYETLKEKPRPVKIEKFSKKKIFKKRTHHVGVSVMSPDSSKRIIYDLPSASVDYVIDHAGKLEIDPRSIKVSIKQEKKKGKVKRIALFTATAVVTTVTLLIISR